MKKILLILFLIAALCFAACGNDTADSDDSGTGAATDSDTVGGEGGEEGGEDDALDIWHGVEGDELEFKLTSGGDSLNVVLNRDGSCYTYTEYGETMTGADFNQPELDAELGMYPTNYGSYEVKDGEISATLDSQVYYRFVATGKDADALKDACFEVNMSEEHREGYYGKGIIMSETEGTIVLACSFDGETYTTASVTTYDESGAKIAVSVPNADGSYKNTSYYPDGTVYEIRDYDADDVLLRCEAYSEDGTLEYVETVVREDGRSMLTRTDAEGNVIRTEERKRENHENGGYWSEDTIIENGVTISYHFYDEKVGADGIGISSYSVMEQTDGNKVTCNVEYTDHKDATNNYVRSTETVDGVLTYYFCSIEKVTEKEGYEQGRQNVRYDPDRDVYSLSIEYIDESGSLVGIGYDYPADEYVHGEWETFEYEAE